MIETDDLEALLEELLGLFEMRVAASHAKHPWGERDTYTSDITRACLWQVRRNLGLLATSRGGGHKKE